MGGTIAVIVTPVVAPLSLLEALSSVPDPRRKRGTRHPLAAVLALVSVATMCGYRSVYAALQWGRDHGKEVAAKLGLGRHGIPSDAMMSNLLRRLDVVAFEAALARWAASWPAGAEASDPDHLEPVAVDGKTLRGARGHEVPGVHLLAAYAARLGIVLNQVPAGANKEEGGEVTAAPALLEGLVLQGKIITGDAIHAQRELCQQIVGGGGEYVLAVKENQPKLLRRIENTFRFPLDPAEADSPFLTPPKTTSTGRGWSGGASA